MVGPARRSRRTRNKPPELVPPKSDEEKPKDNVVAEESQLLEEDQQQQDNVDEEDEGSDVEDHSRNRIIRKAASHTKKSEASKSSEHPRRSRRPVARKRSREQRKSNSKARSRENSEGEDQGNQIPTDGDDNDGDNDDDNDDDDHHTENIPEEKGSDQKATITKTSTPSRTRRSKRMRVAADPNVSKSKEHSNANTDEEKDVTKRKTDQRRSSTQQSDCEISGGPITGDTDSDNEPLSVLVKRKRESLQKQIEKKSGTSDENSEGNDHNAQDEVKQPLSSAVSSANENENENEDEGESHDDNTEDDSRRSRRRKKQTRSLRKVVDLLPVGDTTDISELPKKRGRSGRLKPEAASEVNTRPTGKSESGDLKKDASEPSDQGTIENAEEIQKDHSERSNDEGDASTKGTSKKVETILNSVIKDGKSTSSKVPQSQNDKNGESTEKESIAQQEESVGNEESTMSKLKGSYDAKIAKADNEVDKASDGSVKKKESSAQSTSESADATAKAVELDKSNLPKDGLVSTTITTDEQATEVEKPPSENKSEKFGKIEENDASQVDNKEKSHGGAKTALNVNLKSSISDKIDTESKNKGAKKASGDSVNNDLVVPKQEISTKNSLEGDFEKTRKEAEHSEKVDFQTEEGKQRDKNGPNTQKSNGSSKIGQSSEPQLESSTKLSSAKSEDVSKNKNQAKSFEDNVIEDGEKVPSVPAEIRKKELQIESKSKITENSDSKAVKIREEESRQVDAEAIPKEKTDESISPDENQKVVPVIDLKVRIIPSSDLPTNSNGKLTSNDRVEAAVMKDTSVEAKSEIDSSTLTSSHNEGKDNLVDTKPKEHAAPTDGPSRGASIGGHKHDSVSMNVHKSTKFDTMTGIDQKANLIVEDKALETNEEASKLVISLDNLSDSQSQQPDDSEKVLKIRPDQLSALPQSAQVEVRRIEMDKKGINSSDSSLQTNMTELPSKGKEFEAKGSNTEKTVIEAQSSNVLSSQNKAAMAKEFAKKSEKSESSPQHILSKPTSNIVSVTKIRNDKKIPTALSPKNNTSTTKEMERKSPVQSDTKASVVPISLQDDFSLPLKLEYKVKFGPRPVVSPSAKGQTSPSIENVSRNRTDQMKAMLYIAGSKVHHGVGFERKFSEYWDAMALRLSDHLSMHTSKRCNQVIDRFLKTPRIRKLHNRFILHLIRRTGKKMTTDERLFDHTPSKWRDRIPPSRPVLREALNEIPVTKEPPVFRMMDTIEPRYRELWNPFDNVPRTHLVSQPSAMEAFPSSIPGALSIDPLVRKIVERKGLQVSELAVWLMSVAVKEHTKKVMKCAIAHKEAFSRGVLSSRALKCPNPIAGRFKTLVSNDAAHEIGHRTTNEGPQSERILSALDIYTGCCSMPCGKAGSIGGAISRNILDQTLSLAYDPHAFVPSGDLSGVQQYLSDTILSQGRQRSAAAPSSSKMDQGVSIQSKTEVKSERKVQQQAIPQTSTVAITSHQTKPIVPTASSETRGNGDNSQAPSNIQVGVVKTEREVTVLNAVRKSGQGGKNLAALKERTSTDGKVLSKVELQANVPAPVDTVASDKGVAIAADTKSAVEAPPAATLTTTSVAGTAASINHTADASKDVKIDAPMKLTSEEGPEEADTEANDNGQRSGKGFGTKNLAAMRARSTTKDSNTKQ